MCDSMMQLALVLVENFPYVSTYKRFLVYRSLFTLFAALYSKSCSYDELIHNFGTLYENRFV